MMRPASAAWGRAESAEAAGVIARTTTPASTPLHRVRAPDNRFSDEREKDPPAG
jgi:hypothetical protein